jgi:predicted transcriptional regulator
MKVLWEADGPLIASEIRKRDASLNINTVQAAINSLMRREMIHVADIVYSGTVLSRCYEPLMTADEYFAKEINDLFPESDHFSVSGFVAAFLSNSKREAEEIKEIEKLIKERNEALNK